MRKLNGGFELEAKEASVQLLSMMADILLRLSQRQSQFSSSAISQNQCEEDNSNLPELESDSGSEIQERDAELIMSDEN